MYSHDPLFSVFIKVRDKNKLSCSWIYGVVKASFFDNKTIIRENSLKVTCSKQKVLGFK